MEIQNVFYTYVADDLNCDVLFSFCRNVFSALQNKEQIVWQTGALSFAHICSLGMDLVVREIVLRSLHRRANSPPQGHLNPKTFMRVFGCVGNRNEEAPVHLDHICLSFYLADLYLADIFNIAIKSVARQACRTTKQSRLEK